MTMRWDRMTIDEKQQACLEARGRGLSTTAIGIELGTSRNAVCGLFFRIAAAATAKGVEPPQNTFAARHRPRDDGKPKAGGSKAGRGLEPTGVAAADAVVAPSPVKLPSLPAAAPAQPHVMSPPVLFLDRRFNSQCAWPVGDETVSILDRLCCGAATGGGSYCAEHRARATARPRAQRTLPEARP